MFLNSERLIDIMTDTKKIYAAFIILAFLFSISLASAVTYQQWTDVQIRHPIRIDGAPSSAILANITIRNPDNLVISTGRMTFNSSTLDYNYTLFGGKTGDLGTYNYDITATGSGINQTSSFSFDITPSGDSGVLGFYFLMIILSYGVLVLGIFKQDVPITVLGTFALYFVGLYVMFNGLDVYKNYLTNGFSIITLGVAFYVSVRMAHELILD